MVNWNPSQEDFNKSPEEVTDYLVNNSKDHQQAAEKLNYFLNRGNHNFSLPKIKELHTVFSLLDKHYNNMGRYPTLSESILNTSKEVLETVGKLVKNIVIKDGKKQVVTSREYNDKPKEGYKRDNETGKTIKMSPEERINRSQATSKSANDSKTKRNKKISMNRRKSLIN